MFTIRHFFQNFKGNLDSPLNTINNTESNLTIKNKLFLSWGWQSSETIKKLHIENQLFFIKLETPSKIFQWRPPKENEQF